MRKKNNSLLLGILIFGILSLAMVSVVSAPMQQQDFTNPTANWQYSQPNFQSYYSSEQLRTYWPVLNDIENEQCTATSDFLVAIRPGGCTPMVVRSDLLSEQNVPVFCQLDAVRVNPLIKVSSIKSISFKGKYPEGVTGISFHPARAAIKSHRTLLGSPLLNNIGYVVIVLKKTKTEDEMPDWVSGNLTATVYYDAENVYGTGRAEYYLPVMSDANWSAQYKDYGFWYGKGFLRVKDVGDGNAKIVLYTDKEKIFQEVTLEEGKTSSLMYFPGFYCKAGLKVKLNKVVAPENQAKLNIDNQDIWVRRGTKILNNKCTVTKIEAAQDRTGNISISCRGGQKIKLSLEELEDDDEEKISSDLLVETYFDEASEAVKKLVDDFPAEGGMVEKYGEIALLEQAKLAEDIGKFQTAKQLYQRFIDTYPDSKNIEGVRKDLFRISNFDSSKAYASFFINNDHHTIRIGDFKAVDEGAKTVKIRVAGTDYTKEENENITLTNNENLLVKKIEPNQVTLIYNYQENNNWKSETKTLKERDSINRGGKEIMIQQLNVGKVAYVSLIPEIKNTKTEANFTFKIGIEKRAIQLSPDKTERMIENLNESIEKWEGINEDLYNVIKGLKGACFATSTFLMLKSLMSGFSGESMARQKVMEKYKRICDTEHPGMTHTACYNLPEISSKIKQDVTAMKKAIEDTNKHIADIEKQPEHQISKGWLGTGTVINHSGALEDYRGSFVGERATVNITVDGKPATIEVANINSFTQLREAELLNRLEAPGSGASKEIIEGQRENVNRELAPAYRLQQGRELQERMKGKEGILQIPVSVSTPGERSIVYRGTSEGFERDSLVGMISDDVGKVKVNDVLGEERTHVGAQIVHIDTTSYLVLTEPRGGPGEMPQLGVFKVQVGNDGKLTVEGPKEDYLPEAKGASMVSISGGDCSNKYLNPKVRFYETSPDVHLPAIVPFDIDDGWYVKVPQSVGGLLGSGAGGYKASGDVSFFYICNVGKNGRMDNMKYDDICQSFDVNTYSSVDKFGGCPTLSASNVQQLARKARGAIREAAQQFGKSSVGISNVGNFLVDAPMTGAGELVECQDFMSPEDCKLLFNVCDPVICPSSRCNLGGKYPVANVVQTGIIGSLTLCLPNKKEGVWVPICLTGVHAGLDSYLSILKSERDCLQRSLDTGELVGICDEITSVYLCEFFWRQLAPLIKIVIPKLIESAYGMQGARGGGEYLTVTNAWQNMEKSVSYFKDTYAQNAFRAFQFGSIEEAGGTFCQAFIGTSVPGSANFLDSLLEPESPEQFYARFSETTFSDATVPSTSHYKVYYHIFAGNNKGVHYSVYLKNPPATSYYRANPIVQVKTGYVAKGESADESVDITAPSGYKELCVVIDAQTYCDFKQVTTDFGLDYLKNKYTEEQAEMREIASERECISGSPSMLALVNPSIQAGVEEAVQPQIALRGIVRICATQNPGASTATTNESRWKDVGYCDSPGIRCWLDSESVREDIEQVQAIDRTLAGTEEDARRLDDRTVLTPDATRNEITELKQKINELNIRLEEAKPFGYESDVTEVIGDIIARLEDLIEGDEGRASSNAGIGEALGLKANVYQIVVRVLDKGRPTKPDAEAIRRAAEEIATAGAKAEGEELEKDGEEEKPKGFTLSDDNKILDDGEETVFYLVEIGTRGYLIKQMTGNSSSDKDKIVGTILIKDRGNVVPNELRVVGEVNKILLMELGDYMLEDREFKEQGPIALESSLE